MTKKTVVISATVLALGALLAVGVISLTDGAGHDHSISFKSGCIRRDDIEEKIVLKNPAAPDDSETLNVTYDKSLEGGDGYSDVYTDGDGNEYVFKDGKLSGYHSSDMRGAGDLADCAGISAEEACNIAVKAFESFGIDMSDLKLKKVQDRADSGFYDICFLRTVGGFYVNEGVTADISYDGKLVSYSSSLLGKFNSLTPDMLSGITEECLKAYARSQALEVYGDGITELNLESYTVYADRDGRYYILLAVEIGVDGDKAFADDFKYYLD